MKEVPLHPLNYPLRAKTGGSVADFFQFFCSTWSVHWWKVGRVLTLGVNVDRDSPSICIRSPFGSKLAVNSRKISEKVVRERARPRGWTNCLTVPRSPIHFSRRLELPLESATSLDACPASGLFLWRWAMGTTQSSAWVRLSIPPPAYVRSHWRIGLRSARRCIRPMAVCHSRNCVRLVQPPQVRRDRADSF